MIKTHGGNIYKFARNNQIALGEILDFSANINPLGISKKAKFSLENNLIEIMNYPDPEYYDLKKAISKHEGVSVDHVILGNGAIECIFLLAEHLKSQHVLILAPTFVEYERAFSKYNANVSFYNLFKKSDFTLDIKAFIKAIPDHVDTILICNPNNPTGNVVQQADLLALLAYCKEKAINLVIDEAFVDFLVNEEDYTLKTFIHAYTNLTIIKSLTKFFALPGLRLGYLLTSNASLHDYINKHRMPWTINGVVSNMALQVLEDRDYIKATKTYVEAQRQYLKKALNDIHGIKVISGEANYIFLTCAFDIKNLLEAFKIMIRDCSNYRGLNSNYYRVAVKDAKSNEILVNSLKIIEQEQ